MPFAVDRRPLKPGEENDLWKFVYDNVVTNKNYPSLFELFKAYRRQGHLQNYGLTEVEFHFHKRMLRNLYKTDGLTPTEILKAYRHFQIPIEAEVRKILDILTNANLRCNKSGVLQSWRPKPPSTPVVKREPRRRTIRLPAIAVVADPLMPKRKKKTVLTGYMEVRMWSHLAKRVKKIKHTDVLTLEFWAKMKLHCKYSHITPEMLLAYFNETLCHRLYYLDMDAESKAWLIHNLSMKPTRAQILWMLRTDKIFVEVGTSGFVTKWSLWKERRPEVQMLPLEGYAPIKQYEPRPYFFYEHRIRYEARLNAYQGLKADFNGVIRIPTTRQRERVPEEFSEYLEFVEETKNTLNLAAAHMLDALLVMRRVLPDEEDQRTCDRVLMQMEMEWLQAVTQKILNILKTMNPSIQNPPLKEIKIHRCFWPFAEDEDEEGFEASDEVYENHEEGVDPPLNYFFFVQPKDMYVGSEEDYQEHRARRAEAKRRRRQRDDRVERIEEVAKLDEMEDSPRAQEILEMSVKEEEEEGASEDVEEDGSVVEEGRDDDDDVEFDDVRMESEDEDVGGEADAEDEDEDEDEESDAVESVEEEEHEVVDISSDDMEHDLQPSPPSAPPSPLPATPRPESAVVDVDTVSSDDEPMARRLGSSQESSYLPVVYDPVSGVNADDQINPYEIMILDGMPDDEWRRIERRLSAAEEAEDKEEVEEENALYYNDEEDVDLAIQKDAPSTSTSSNVAPSQPAKQESLEPKSRKRVPVLQPSRRSTRIAHRNQEVEEPKKPQLPPGTIFARGPDGVYTFGSFQFYVDKDHIARAVLPPTTLVYEKIISDSSDIVKYYAQLDKPPISFADRGISFVRDGAKFELKLVNKSKASIEEERGRKEVKTTRNQLQMLRKRRAMSPVCSATQPPVKSHRMSSTRHYSPSSRIDSNDYNDNDIHKSVLFAKNRGVFPVVRQLNIPDFQ